MFRSLIIEDGEKVTVSHHVLQVERGEETVPIPVEDVYCLVLDNPRLLLSAYALAELAQAGAHVVVCGPKHMPAGLLYPELIHYRPYGAVKKQVELTQGLKDALWDRIVKAKLQNQAEALSLCGADERAAQRIRELAEEVAEGDGGNREGIGAKLYFRALFGSHFIRMHDDGINGALNYGYAILRSAVAKTLYLFGLYPPLGIHHIGASNPFNLADDLMEPFRPLVDLWADLHREELALGLTAAHRRQLVNLVNLEWTYGGGEMKVRNVIIRYVKSFVSAMESGDPDRLEPPRLGRGVYDRMASVCPEP